LVETDTILNEKQAHSGRVGLNRQIFDSISCSFDKRHLLLRQGTLVSRSLKELGRMFMFKGDRLTIAIFALFLLAYSIEKYVVAMPPIFDPAYLQSVAIIVALTAIIPFAFMWLLRRRFATLAAHSAVMIIGCIALSALGYAAYWYFTVSSFPNAPPVDALAVRGIRPGLLMAAALIIGRWRA
jgi:hypothetical protein